MISWKNIIEFTYSESIQEYKHLLNKKLILLECKHIALINDTKTKKILDTAKFIGYQWCIFWSHRENPSIKLEKNIISSMEQSNDFNRPVRIVIDQNNWIWADNTHSVIAYCMRYWYNSKIKDIPFYIVDLRQGIYKIISYNQSVLIELDSIKSAIGSAERIKKYVEAWYRWNFINSWKIKDLMIQLNYFDGTKKNDEI